MLRLDRRVGVYLTEEDQKICNSSGRESWSSRCLGITAEVSEESVTELGR